jgi:hypothetical protein
MERGRREGQNFQLGSSVRGRRRRYLYIFSHVVMMLVGAAVYTSYSSSTYL